VLLDRFGVSERRAYKVLKQPRASQRYLPMVRDDELPLSKRIIELACMYGRYGYRRVTALLRWDGWHVNHKRVERIWKREGLKVPTKQPKRGRLWLNDGSWVRLRPEHRDHVWSYDFVQGRTSEGRPFRMLTVIDEYTRECLAIDVGRHLKSDDVLERLAWLMATPICRVGRARTFPIGQWCGVYGQGGACLAREGRREDAVHRAGLALGERVHRELQREAAGRVAQRRDLHDAAGGAGADRAVAEPLQHGEAALVAGVPASGARGDHSRGLLRSAAPGRTGNGH
jgi:hypothetical protein